MGKLEKWKEEYDNIPIPEELSVRIQQEIEKSRSRETEKNRAGYRIKKAVYALGTAAAAVCIIFTAALNTNQVFAQGASEIPVIGKIAKVLTFRSYETEQDDIGLSVEIPSIENIAEDTRTEDEINQEIYDLCEQYAKEAVSQAEEYRNAFLSTGGTPEEWAEHHVKVTVDYEIKQQNDHYISLVVRGSDNWTNAYNESKYYNLSTDTGKLVTLEDMLGSDYIQQANESIRKQIAEREKEGKVFFTEEQGGFTGITENTKFYINENNRPVIIFDKYEIAPGSSGEIEFEIGDS